RIDAAAPMGAPRLRRPAHARSSARPTCRELRREPRFRCTGRLTGTGRGPFLGDVRATLLAPTNANPGRRPLSTRPLPTGAAWERGDFCSVSFYNRPMYTPLLARLIDSCADIVGSEEDRAGMEAEWLEVFRSFGGDSAASFEASQ